MYGEFWHNWVSGTIHKRAPSCHAPQLIICHPIRDYINPLAKFWFGTLIVCYTSILPIVCKPPSNHHGISMMRLVLH